MSGWEEAGTGGKIEPTYTMGSPTHTHTPVQFIYFASCASCGTKLLPSLDYPAPAQQSCSVVSGWADPQAAPLNLHGDLWPGALHRTGGSGIAHTRDSTAAAQDSFPKPCSFTCSLQCDNAALSQVPCQEQHGNSTRAASGNQTRAVHACWPNLGGKMRALLRRSRK